MTASVELGGLWENEPLYDSRALRARLQFLSRYPPPCSPSARPIDASFARSQNSRSAVRPTAPAVSSEASAALIFGRLPPSSNASPLWEYRNSTGTHRQAVPDHSPTSPMS